MGWNHQLEWVSGDVFFLNWVSLGNRQEKSWWKLVGLVGQFRFVGPRCESWLATRNYAQRTWAFVQGSLSLGSKKVGKTLVLRWWNPSTRFVWSNGLNTIKIGVWSIGKYFDFIVHGMGSINWCKMCVSQIVLVESRFRFQCQHGFQNSLTRKWFQSQHVFQLIILVHLCRENYGDDL